MSILLPELLIDLKTQSKIEQNDLRLFDVLRIGSDEDVAWMRVAVDEAGDEKLFVDCSYQMIHDYLFIEVVLVEFLGVGDFEAVDPFGDEYSFGCKLIINLGHIDLVPF